MAAPISVSNAVWAIETSFRNQGVKRECRRVQPGNNGLITGATNATPIVITSANHGMQTGMTVVINSVLGNTAANGTFKVTVVDGNTFSLQTLAGVNVAGNGAFIPGQGQWWASAGIPITTTQATAQEIEIGNYASGEIYIPSGSSITTLTYYSAPAISTAALTATYTAAQDHTGTAITQTVAAGKSYPLPADLFGSGAIQMTANAVGVVEITLKT